MDRVLIAILLIGISITVSAGIYRWVDENGKVHFSDKASRQHESDSVQIRVNTYESVSYESSDIDTGKQVIMYSTSWCGYCKKAKAYFNQQGIEFTEYDIENDTEARLAYEQLGATGVPVILVGKKRMNGFSEKGFEQLYR